MSFDANQTLIEVSDSLSKSASAIHTVRDILIASQVRVGEDFDLREPFLNAKLLVMRTTMIDNYHIAKDVYQDIASILANFETIASRHATTRAEQDASNG